ncbi:MAG: hypothetical protein HZB51_31925 [Chloroflexi bacterium]|nr:hypothetical protein [Chloroflexota bacterium]
MSNKRLSVIIAAIALLAIAAGVIQFTGVDLTDYFQRHPNAAIPVTGGVAMDYLQRHPEVIQSQASVELLDFAQRHLPEAASAAKATDYIERHPELLKARVPADLSDWIQRHPEALSKTMNEANDFDRMTGTYLPGMQGLASVRVDEATDYIERHSEMLRSKNAADLSDWFQRHLIVNRH